MGGFARTEIDVRSLDGIRRIGAYRCEHFAVHQCLQANGLFGMDWCVTHVPSGIGFGRYFPSRPHAEGAATAIAALRDDWITFDPKTVTPKFIASLIAIFTEYQGERHPQPEANKLVAELGRKHYAADLNGYGDKTE